MPPIERKDRSVNLSSIQGVRVLTDLCCCILVCDGQEAKAPWSACVLVPADVCWSERVCDQNGCTFPHASKGMPWNMLCGYMSVAAQSQEYCKDSSLNAVRWRKIDLKATS